MSEQIRCRNCGRPLNTDERQNFFPFCYDCFKDHKSSKMKQGTAMRIIGIVGLVFVSLYIFMFSMMFSFYNPYRTAVFIIGSIIAVLIPVLLIVFGTRKKRKWSTIFTAKPIEPQQVIPASPPIHTIPTQKKFCPECGAKIDSANQKYCVSCGSEI